jgi:hypothetical protein
MTTPTIPCTICEGFINVCDRRLNWHCRPRRGSDSWEVFDVTLCHDCFTHPDIQIYNLGDNAPGPDATGDDYLIGEDWWEALPDLY